MGWVALVSVIVFGASASGTPGPTLAPPWGPSSGSASAAQIEALERLVTATPESDPSRPDLVLRLAELYGRSPDRADRDRAIELLGDLIDARPRFGRRDDALFALAAALARRGDARESRRRYLQLIRDFPRSRWVPMAYADFGDHFFSAGDMNKARAFYDKALQFPKSQAFAYALYKSGWVAINLGDHARALETFFKLHNQARRQPAMAQAARDALVVAYAPVGRASKAFMFFRRVDVAAADAMHRRLARVYVDRGQDAEAIAAYRELITRNPRDPALCRWQAEIARAALRSLSSADAARELRLLRRLGRRVGRPECARLATEIQQAP